MLTRLRLRDFKSWQDTGEVVLRPITGSFGANSSGKTSLFQALLVLKQTGDWAGRGLALHLGDASTLVNLGDFTSVVYRHSTDDRISALDWKIPRPLRVTDTAHADRIVVESQALSFNIWPRGRPARVPAPAKCYGFPDSAAG